MTFILFLLFLLLSLQPAYGGEHPFLYGYEAFKEGRYQEALSRLDSLQEKDILYEYALYFKGLTLLKMGDYRRAERTFRTFLERYPDSVFRTRATLKLAETLFLKGDMEKARSTLKGLERESWEAMYLMARGLEREGDMDGAFDIYLRLWRDHPWEAKGVDEVVRRFKERGYTISPSDQVRRIENLYRAMTGAIEKGKIKDRAISELKSLDLSALGRDLLMRAGRLSYRLGALSFGRKIFQALLRMVKGDERAEALYYLSLICYRKGERGCAETFLKELITSFPDYRTKALYLLSRLRKDEGRLQEALSILEGLYRDGSSSPAVIWDLAWVNYTLKRYAESIRYLEVLKGFPSARDKALYWLGRIHLKMDRRRGMAFLRELVASGRISYYTFMAEERLRAMGRWYPEGPLDLKVDGLAGSGTGPFKRAKVLVELGLSDLARDEILKRLEGMKDPLERLKGIHLLEEIGAYYDAIGLSTPYLERAGNPLKTLYLRYAYPRGYREEVYRKARASGVDPLLVYAVIREESHFHPRLTSPAHAVGLMQIIPSTGRYLARIEGRKAPDLFNPEENIALGVAYMKRLLKDFNGNIILALAAYNGGPGNLRRWLDVKEGLEVDEFLEEVPYDETRRYVKKVIKSYYIYRLLYRDG